MKYILSLTQREAVIKTASLTGLLDMDHILNFSSYKNAKF
jgi:hypothetical protein